jgi:type 1 glutamine amidotransferase
MQPKRVAPVAFGAALALLGTLPSLSSAQAEQMLVFTKTLEYRHDSIPAAVATIRELASRHGIQVEHSEQASHFNEEQLSRFKAVAFVNTTGNVLGPGEKRALENFIATGGGFLGIHSAADTHYDWPTYGALVGARFKSHPPGLQTGIVRFVRPLGPGWPTAWRVTDEFYNFRSPPPPDADVIASLDENSYEGGEMGPEHPISWCRKIMGGRSWYTGLGHSRELFSEPIFLAHLERGLRYAMSQYQDC